MVREVEFSVKIISDLDRVVLRNVPHATRKACIRVLAALARANNQTNIPLSDVIPITPHGTSSQYVVWDVEQRMQGQGANGKAGGLVFVVKPVKDVRCGLVAQ
jgi:hypothetical protein